MPLINGSLTSLSIIHPTTSCHMQSYSRDLFIFLFVILTCVAIGASMQTVKAPVLLVRQQTEEWKGWMQVGLHI